MNIVRHYDTILMYHARILFQRGVYPADDFHMVKKYGQTVLVTQDLALENYLEKYVALSAGWHDNV